MRKNNKRKKIRNNEEEEGIDIEREEQKEESLRVSPEVP